MSEGVMQVIGYVGIVVFALLAAAVIARFRLEFYEIGKERLLKRKIREKNPDSCCESIAGRRC